MALAAELHTFSLQGRFRLQIRGWILVLGILYLCHRIKGTESNDRFPAAYTDSMLMSWALSFQLWHYFQKEFSNGLIVIGTVTNGLSWEIGKSLSTFESHTGDNTYTFSLVSYIKGKGTFFLTTLWPCMNWNHDFLSRYLFLKDGTMKNNSVFKISGP